ncbi:hypothetical protein GCM10008967_05570 [Bacillus carboniphilus]|uniref:Uncharacterized protein n=1 Tax=Bacillus carboniphilus TaxID=86663 RepID=A0ABN0VUU1_9BACI
MPWPEENCSKRERKGKKRALAGRESQQEGTQRKETCPGRKRIAARGNEKPGNVPWTKEERTKRERKPKRPRLAPKIHYQD